MTDLHPVPDPEDSWSADPGTQELPDLLGGLGRLGRAERALVDVGQAFADL
jgi:hypothetical protein